MTDFILKKEGKGIKNHERGKRVAENTQRNRKSTQIEVGNCPQHQSLPLSRKGVRCGTPSHN
jgi:hypothetical protein